MRRIGGVVLTVTGFLACPCHLIITLPLLATLLAGTALGSFLTRNTSLVYTLATVYFIVALVLGGTLLFDRSRPSRKMVPARSSCPNCAFVEPEAPVASETQEDLPITERMR